MSIIKQPQLSTTVSRWEQFSSRQQTSIILVLMTIIAAVMGLASSYEEGHFDWHGMGGNLSSEIFGGVITYLVIDRVIGGKREEEAKREALDERRQDLIERLGSRINAECIRAAEELRARGWLEDGSIEGATLNNADMQNANFEDAYFEEVSFKNVNLYGANLKNATLNKCRLIGANLHSAILYRAKITNCNFMKADLRRVNLQESDLTGAGLKRARMQEADLWRASLTRAYLVEADLENANLSRANLCKANLTDANLRNVNLKSVTCDEDTILPDGQKWTRQTDVTRFTDPNHRNFWRSDSTGSPAYHGYEPGNQHEEM